MRAFVLPLIASLALPLFVCAPLSPAIGSSVSFTHPELTPVGGPLIITAFKPPAEYARWYANMERCLGAEGKYDKVRWFVTPEPWRGSDKVRGITHGANLGHDRILVNALEWRDSVLVEHEAVHHILHKNDMHGTMNHPPPYFDEAEEGGCANEFYTPVAER